ncbi:hypothetical protein GQ53DRAFT_839926 [Thozetella sp. PMI_491]|nr:hypothetical protein GQ53DRAFT_839926 [Thozetella sp. PMI_491]
MGSKPFAVVDNDQGGFRIEQAVPAETRYKYEKLPSKGSHVRLLTLMPGNDSQLEATLASYDLESPQTPSYAALSYCWQNPKFDELVIDGKQIAPDDEIRSKYVVCHPLLCNGNNTHISTSLRDALRKLRHKTKPRTFWVDALCINQEDIAERATQVLLMQRIYHQASEICMWLGREDKFAAAAFDLLAQLRVAAGRPAVGQDLYHSGAMQRLDLPVFPSAPWEALVRLLERPYFRRIWIVQEMIASPLAAKLYCGGIRPLPWTTILKAISFLTVSNWLVAIDASYGGQNTMSFVSITALVGMEWMKGSSTSEDRARLRRMALRTRRFEATDPRDKVFALVGIINDFGHRELHGQDSPEGSNAPQAAVRDGTAHLTFKVDERGKSREDIAIEILQTNSDEMIAKLHTSLIGYLRGCVRIADVLLHPDEPRTSTWLQDYGAVVQKTIEGMFFIHEFHKKFSKSSFNHQRTGDFALNTYKMFSHNMETFNKIITEHCESAQFPLICSLEEVREEVGRFREGTAFVLETIETKPGANQNTGTKSDDKTPILMGDRKTLENLEYNVTILRQYPDWAWSAAGWVMPMYDKPTEQVFAEFTVKYIQDDGNLDILSHVEDHSVRQISKLPSWAPDFSVAMSRHPLPSKDDVNQNPVYSASGDATTTPKWTLQAGEVLGLSGYEFDEIVAVASSAYAENEIGNRPQEWNAFIQKLPGQYPSGCATGEALWRTIIGDRAKQRQTYSWPAPDEYQGHYATLQRLRQLNLELDSRVDSGEDGTQALLQLCASNGIDPAEMPRMFAEKNKFTEAMSEVMIERRLFFTKGGYLGAGPLSTRPGDAVYVLAGGSTPFVLRRETSSKDSEAFELVGDCYLHGIMHGEALKKSGFLWKDLRLV